MSSWRGLNLFGSGPHRFRVGLEGEYVLENQRFDIFLHGSTPIGPLELKVFVTGRLVAASESALWTLRDAITAELDDPPKEGTLIDEHGREWDDMAFIRFETGDRTDRGRARSISYVAEFREFNSGFVTPPETPPGG